LAMDGTADDSVADSFKNVPFTKPEFWLQFPTAGIKIAINCVVAFILFGIFYLVVSVLLRFIKSFLNSPKFHLRHDLTRAVTTSLKILIWVQLVPIIVTQIGIPVDSIITVIGAITLGLGMAFRPVIENFVAGAMLITLDSFQDGDVVDVAGVKGVITSTHISYTKMEEPDGSVVFIPNMGIYKKSMQNFSAKGRVRLDTDFTLEPSISTSRLVLARKVLVEAVARLEKVLKDPAPVMVIKDITEHGVVVRARYWIDPKHYFVAGFAVNEAVREAFLENNINFAQLHYLTPTKAHVGHLSTHQGDAHESDANDAMVAAAAMS